MAELRFSALRDVFDRKPLEVEPPSEIPVVVGEEFTDSFIPFLKRNLD